MTVVWDELVGAGLLGTDRRRPPVPADRAVADVVDDALPPNDARRLLVTVAATVVAQRCGVLPADARAAEPGVPDDPRPMISMAAAETWRQIVATEPLLEAEWLDLAAANGWRPSPDVLVDLLRRNVNRPAGHAAVMRFGGPLAEWLVGSVPTLDAIVSRGRPAPARPAVPGVPAVAGVTGSSVVADVSAVPPGLLVSFERDAGAFCAELVDGVQAGRYTWPQRLTLHHALAELPAAWLSTVLAAITRERERAAAADATADVGGIAHAHALWEDLLEVAALRRRMHDELEIVR